MAVLSKKHIDPKARKRQRHDKVADYHYRFSAEIVEKDEADEGAAEADANTNTTSAPTDAADVAEGVRLCREATGPVFVAFKVDDAPEAAAIPPKDGAFLKTRFRQAVVGKI